MKLTSMPWTFLLCLVCSVGSGAETEQDPIPLFNGRNLDGLYTFLSDTKYEDPRKVFTVQDGLLRISGDGLGAVITKKAYGNYRLILEYRWGERTWGNRKDRAKDSGLLVHSVGKDGGYNGIWMPSIEVQIIEGGTGDFILVTGEGEDNQPVPLSITCEIDEDRDGEPIWKKGGRRSTFDLTNRRRVNWFGRDPDWKDVLGFRGQNDVEKPDGEWNRLEVTCRGDSIRTELNGTTVNEAFHVFPTAGKIQIQSELAELFIRRWELHKLAASG